MLEDFAALAVEDSEADRAPRPFCIGSGADRGGGAGGLDFGFGDKRRAAIVGGGKKLKPEPLRPRRKNAIHLFQRINLGEKIGRPVAPGLRRARPAEGRQRPAKRRTRLSSTIEHRKIASDAAADGYNAAPALLIAPQPNPAGLGQSRPILYKKAISSGVKLHNRRVQN
ncbi:MAG TPA: hypothetical protein VGF57_05320 [Roseiarcus sp.]